MSPVAGGGWPDESGPDEDGRGAGGAGPATGRHRHGALVVLVVLLAGAVAAEAWYLWRPSDPQPSSGRPVVTGPVETTTAVDAAARALQEIVSTSWRSYDEQVEQAAGLMTETFAEEYRVTAGEAKESVVEERTEVSVDVLAQGVIQATPDQVQALVFLDQSVTKRGDGPRVTPYRARVTVTRTDQGWLVSGIDTR